MTTEQRSSSSARLRSVRNRHSFRLTVALMLISMAATTAAQDIEGFAEPKTLVAVASPEPGTIHEVLVRQGQTVKRGDPLIQMDTETLLPALDLSKAKAESRAALNAAQIELQLKQRRFENLSKLGKDNSSSEELLRAQADVDLAQTQVLKAEEEIRQNVLDTRLIETQLARRTIRSPINGVVTRIHRQAGEFVGSTEPQVVSVADLSQLRIVFFPPSEHIEHLEHATRAEVRMERVSGQSSIAQSDESGRDVRAPGARASRPQNSPPFRTDMERGQLRVPATIDFVSPITNADSGTVRVELLIDNPAGQFRSGLRCWLDDIRPTSESAERSATGTQAAEVPIPGERQ